MSSPNVTLTGVKETLNVLNKMDKELSKQFRARLQDLAAPLVRDVADAYGNAGLPLSGMRYKWGRDTKAGKRRLMFPYEPSKAAKSLKVNFDTRRNAIGVIGVVQKNPAAAIFEVAGRKNANKLDDSLDNYASRGWKVQKPSRILGPILYRAARKRDMAEQLIKVVDEMSKVVNVKLGRI